MKLDRVWSIASNRRITSADTVDAGSGETAQTMKSCGLANKVASAAQNGPAPDDQLGGALRNLGAST